MDKVIKIWDEFADELKKFILSRIKERMDADDILQEVFIKIHNNIETLKEETKIRAWIYQITRNTIIDFHRRKKNTTDEFPSVDFFEEIKEENPSDRLVETIRLMIDELPPAYSEAVCLSECYGIEQKEIAQKIGLSLSGTKSRIQRGRQMLKNELMKCCHYEFDKYGTIVDYHKIDCCCCNDEK